MTLAEDLNEFGYDPTGPEAGAGFRYQTTPSPGSDEAIAEGCTCPVLDNAHGRGYMGVAGVFVYTEGCPVHGHEFDRVIASAEAGNG